MRENLSEYTKAKSIASPDILSNDVNAPYTFQSWIQRNTGILPGKENLQYETYVRDWYKTKKEQLPTSTSIKEDYIQLLKQLTLAFKSEAEEEWASDMDFEDPYDLEQIIPFYATKLKEIAIYFINKREAIRRAKLKYNMTGTNTALERIFHEYLLKAFTKKTFTGNEYTTNITEVSVLNVIPELSAVNAGFQIQIEELYDDASYMDRDPVMPVSAYFTFDANVTSYLDTLNITPAQYEWLYSTGVSTLCADNPLLWSVDNVMAQYKNGVPLSAVELYDSTILNDYNRIKLTQKYIGENQYILSGGYWIPWKDTVNLDLAAGNNWFYWLSSENAFENDTNQAINALPLIETSLIDSGATAGISLSGADILYLMRDNSLSGAWLRLIDSSTFSAIMSARLSKGRTTFAFPYPGYGLSGEDLEWTGKTFDNLSQTFFYLDKDVQQAVYNAYQNASLTSVSAFDPLYINDTLLVESGATAAERFDQADYIIQRPSFKDAVSDGVYNDSQEYAWLYKMTKTDIPVKTGSNNVYWPFERYTDTIHMFASANQCSPVALSSIELSSFSGAVASYDSGTADKIFKKLTPNASSYIEGAWLKGDPLSTPTGVTGASMASGCHQPNISMRILPDAYGTFIWTEDTINASEIFTNKPHQTDCWYLKCSQFSLFKERPTQEKALDYDQWQKCTCRSVLYSPFGSPGNTFDEYEGMSDYIIALSQPLSSFSFKDWRGSDGRDYKTSNEFGWFKLNGSYAVEPDIGWGSGEWVTNTGAPFMLSAGVAYLYHRTDLKRDDPIANAPYLVIRHLKDSPYSASWMKLTLDKNTNEWKDSGVESDMIVNPGDMLLYDHRDTYSIILTSQSFKFSTRKVDSSQDLNTFSVSALISPIMLPGSSFNIPVPGITDGPIEDAEVYTTTYIPASYYTSPLGPIPISAQIQNLNPQTVTTILSTITSTVIDYYTYTNDATNFMINVSLSGWNYPADQALGPLVKGARPIWVSASDKDNDYTKQKRIDIWSGSPVLVDDYNFVTQPPYSNMYFIGNSYVEYVKRNNTTIIWKQPVRGTASVVDKKWCKLIIDTSAVSNLSSVLYNNVNELVASATNIATDMKFDIIQDTPLLVNYYARNMFTWSQEISNSSLGLPPTGGVWIPIEYGELVTPSAPYANLSNRHYPTFASVPTVGDLYNIKDKGGFFIPKMLGVSTAVSKDRTNVLSTLKLNPNQNLRGVTAVYRELNTYNSDRGLTSRDQIEPVKTEDVNSSWMKASVIQGQRAGIITNAREHQEFMPYQTKYESTGFNDNGIFRQGKEAYDPWFEDLDTTWENPTDWPANWRGQHDINGWYENQGKSGQQMYQWKTDIFGMQYAVLKKEFQFASSYDKKHSIPGSMWTRNDRNQILPASESLKSVFGAAPELSGIDISSLSNETSGVLDIDLWFDTLMIYTSGALFFFHLNYDYTNDIVFSTSDQSNYIITQNSKFGGTWFDEESKTVTICNLMSCEDQLRPVLRKLDLETNEMTYIYNLTSTQTDMSSYGLSAYDHPVFTYDTNTKTYNISYIAYSTVKTGMYVTTINLRDIGDELRVLSAKTIVPEA